MGGRDGKVVLFCTVGTTALYAEDLRYHETDDDLKELMKEHLTLPDGSRRGFERLHSSGGLDLRARVLAAHHAFWQALLRGELKLCEHLRRTSAEMTSSYGLCKGSAAGFHGMLQAGRDRVVFLAPDNPGGKWAAEINADLAGMYLFEQRTGGDVQNEVVRGLDGSGPSFSKIGTTLKDIFDSQTGGYDHVLCNFTGGYKGVIPAITLVCGQMPKVRMFYQHEQMSEVCQIELRQGAQPLFSNEPLPS